MEDLRQLWPKQPLGPEPGCRPRLRVDWEPAQGAEPVVLAPARLLRSATT